MMSELVEKKSAATTSKSIDNKKSFRRQYLWFYISILFAFSLSMAQWTKLFGIMRLNSQYKGNDYFIPSLFFLPADDASFSACLLVKDDNDKLSEWLAYHYTAASLKHLIIGVDPNSTTSPIPIVDLWNRTTDMEILLWEDSYYMPAGDELRKKMRKIPRGSIKKQKFGNQKQNEQLRLHRVRQKEFISSCLLHHQTNKRKWTMIIDTDEYLVFNKKDENGKETIYRENEKLDAHKREVLRGVQEIRKDLPKVGKVSIAEYAEKHKSEQPWEIEPCMSLPRLFFGSMESSESAVRNDVPEIFDAKKYGYILTIPKNAPII